MYVASSVWAHPTRRGVSEVAADEQGYRITLIPKVARLGAMLLRGSIVIALKVLSAMARALTTRPHKRGWI